MKNFISLLFSLCFLLLTDCETSDSDDATDSNNMEINELDTLVTFDLFPPNFEPTNGTGLGEFKEAYWNDNKISLSGSTDDLAISWIEMINLNIYGTGQYELLDNSIGKGAFTREKRVYSTDVSPEFWRNQGQNVKQGGYVNITHYSSNIISGDFYFIAWRWDNSLNREVGIGVSGRFKDVPYKS